MTSSFIGEDFLLRSPLAREIYTDHVKGLPIVDFHNHLCAKLLAEDRRWNDIGELWVVSDPYKHRAMRLCGVEERCISGDADNWEKFQAWCRVFQKTAGGPLFHWSLLELRTVFGTDIVPSADTAGLLWEECNAKLKEDRFSTLGIMRSWNCRRLTTSDDLCNDTSLHPLATKAAGSFEVTPSLRADSILAFDSPSFASWLRRLSPEREVRTIREYLDLVLARLDAFGSSGCSLADHALDEGFRFIDCSEERAGAVFTRLVDGGDVGQEELWEIKSFLLTFLGEEYARRSWVMLLHLGALRHTSSRLRKLSGPAGGYASIGSGFDIRSLCSFLDTLDRRERLPKTILFPLNPADNAAIATLTGSFSEDGVCGKLMFGPAWWYNDHKSGIEAQLQALASYSLLPTFIGMTTDSRSILSFSRHDYFRRILCSFLADSALRGELPADPDWLGGIAADISYHNAERWIYGGADPGIFTNHQRTVATGVEQDGPVVGATSL